MIYIKGEEPSLPTSGDKALGKMGLARRY